MLVFIMGLVCFPLMLFAQAEPVSNSEGKSRELSETFKADFTDYEYFPVDKVFWKTVKGEIAKKNFKSAIYLGLRQEKEFGTDSAEGAEAELVLAEAFLGAKLRFAAQTVLVKISEDRIGTATGEAALHLLSELALGYDYDQESIRDLMDSNVFVGLHSDIQSFVGFQKHIIDLQDGYKDWASAHLKSVRADSQWGYLLSYWRAIAKVAENQIPSAALRLDELAKVDDLHPNTRNLISLQRARLSFERGEFVNASKAYEKLPMKSLREFGRTQLERAWTLFYLKNYSKALGILAALRAPPFLPSLQPERYVLEMIILKQLCHYDEVQRVAENFTQIFDSSLETIKGRKPLRIDPLLHSMALMNKDFQSKANFIGSLRLEKALFQAMRLDKLSFSQNFTDRYQQKDYLLQEQLNLELEVEARKVANELLTVEEEVAFLKYTSQLDGLRIIKRGEGREYKSKRVSYLTFEKIYWLVDDNEYWWKELPDYYTLISSHCTEGDIDRISDEASLGNEGE